MALELDRLGLTCAPQQHATTQAAVKPPCASASSVAQAPSTQHPSRTMADASAAPKQSQAQALAQAVRGTVAVSIERGAARCVCWCRAFILFCYCVRAFLGGEMYLVRASYFYNMCGSAHDLSVYGPASQGRRACSLLSNAISHPLSCLPLCIPYCLHFSTPHPVPMPTQYTSIIYYLSIHSYS